MSTSASVRTVNARFTGAPSSPAEIVTDLRQIGNNAQKAPDWANAPQVQVAVAALLTDADTIEKTMLRVNQLTTELSNAETTLAQQLIDCKQHRKHAEAAITVASHGSVEAVTAWGCTVAGRTKAPQTDEPPRNLTAKTGRTPGDVVIRCKAARARAFVYQYADRPDFPEGSPAPVVTPSSKHILSGLAPGQKVFVRTAVIRTGIGQSRWTEPLQITAR